MPVLDVSGPPSPSELDNVVIHCEVPANPIPEITWLKSSANEVTRILNSSRISIENTVTEMRIVSTLQITRVTAADSGVYVCQADNGLTASPVRKEWIMNITGKYLIVLATQ